MATEDMIMPEHTPISPAPRDIDAIKAQEKASTLPYWNANVAFKLGVNLRTRLLTQERPAVVDISTISTPGHVLFHAVSFSNLQIGSGKPSNKEKPLPLPLSCLVYCAVFLSTYVSILPIPLSLSLFLSFGRNKWSKKKKKKEKRGEGFQSISVYNKKKRQ
jgi:hypothetical protein